MPFDPTKPANNSPDSSAEMRSQLNGLNDMIYAKPSMSDVNTAIAAKSANNVDAIQILGSGVNDPPTQDDGQALTDKLNELITLLKH